MEKIKKLQISLKFDEPALKNLDKVCSKLSLNRPQVMSLLFSGDPDQIDFIVNELKKINN